MGRSKLGDKKKVNLCIRISPEDYALLVEAETNSGLSTTRVIELCLHTENSLRDLAEKKNVKE